jgi:geranylgeranyl diphosphate synthase, type II
MPDFIQQYQNHIEQCLEKSFTRDGIQAERLYEAMRYAVLNGGKRMRPLLVYASGLFCGASVEKLDAAAMAVEYIHCYSLVHDDLPTMDNDDLRRGQPTCHKKFDEATAMLAGDSLQAAAFDLLAHDEKNPPEIRVKLSAVLAKACGILGMAGGQSIDLSAVGQPMSLEDLKTMHQMKTGSLITASIQLGAIIGNASSDVYQTLSCFSESIGLAFQIRDDILDVEGETSTIGKQQGADDALNKPTYPALLGLEKAKALADEAYKKSMVELKGFGEQAEPLRVLANYIVCRDY